MHFVDVATQEWDSKTGCATKSLSFQIEDGGVKQFLWKVMDKTRKSMDETRNCYMTMNIMM